MERKVKLTGILDILEKETSGDTIQMGELVEILNSRGFGSLILIPALITILPTGVIPLVPDVCAIIIIFVSIQILMRKKHPWLPQKVKDFSIKRDKFIKAVEKSRPITKKLDRYFHPRVKLLARKGVEPFIAILCILLSFGIMVMSFIPFLAILPSAGVMFLGLGLTTRDGVLVAAAFLFITACIASVPYVWLTLFG